MPFCLLFVHLLKENVFCNTKYLAALESRIFTDTGELCMSMCRVVPSISTAEETEESDESKEHSGEARGSMNFSFI